VRTAQTPFFSSNPSPKNAGKYSIIFGGRFEEIDEFKQPAIQTKIVQHFIK
jgi:hypothetical protein